MKQIILWCKLLVRKLFEYNIVVSTCSFSTSECEWKCKWVRAGFNKWVSENEVGGWVSEWVSGWVNDCDRIDRYQNQCTISILYWFLGRPP